MSELAVTGYASLDYAVGLGGMVEPDKTTHIIHRDENAWPRAGGSPLYLAQAAVKDGMQANPVTWVGDDALGNSYLEECKNSDVEIDGIVRIQNQRSPVCLMIHQEDSSTACLFDPAFPGQERLGEKQLEMLATSKHVCITVGPGHLLSQILAVIPETTVVYWVTKKDVAAFGETDRAQLAKRANVIFCNKSERDWIDPLDLSKSIIVETHGADGCRITTSQDTQHLEADRVEVGDTTGAGDTFAGAYIAAYSMTGDPLEAGMKAMKRTRDFLNERAGKAGGKIQK